MKACSKDTGRILQKKKSLAEKPSVSKRIKEFDGFFDQGNKKTELVMVNLGNRSYDIRISTGNLFKTDFSKFGNRYAIITDSKVRELYGEYVKRSITQQGLEAGLLEFPAGETSKTPGKAMQIGRELARKGFDKNSIIIALGGGVVGDIAGYVASFFMRGIRYIQMPTTLLAQVDSSIGGKTGVNIPEGKNLFGSFHQPIAVLSCIRALYTLPNKEIRNGTAEIIKYGVIGDAGLFNHLEQNLSSRDDDFYLKIIGRCARIKAGIVGKDEKENESRKILNYGHTIGHAIEAAENYMISHGEALGMGMTYEGRISSRLGLLDRISLDRQNELIRKAGLPVRYEGNVDKLIRIMRKDKKGNLHFILPMSIGNVKMENGKVAFPVEEALVRECLSAK
jgi:3-dehydroquinate synthase